VAKKEGVISRESRRRTQKNTESLARGGGEKAAETDEKGAQLYRVIRQKFKKKRNRDVYQTADVFTNECDE
jgi:hypothetical protein